MDNEKRMRFPILSLIAEIVYALPFSIAEIKRVFSALKLTKTQLRNRLGDKILSDILTVKQSLKRKAWVLDENNKEDVKRGKIYN